MCAPFLGFFCVCITSDNSSTRVPTLSCTAAAVVVKFESVLEATCPCGEMSLRREVNHVFALDSEQPVMGLQAASNKIVGARKEGRRQKAGTAPGTKQSSIFFRYRQHPEDCMQRLRKNGEDSRANCMLPGRAAIYKLF